MAALPLFVLVVVNYLAGSGAINLGERAAPPKDKRWRQELKNIGDLQYYGTASLGHQELYSVIDTGSVELVVVSDICDTWCGAKKYLYHAPKQERSTSYSTLSYGSGDLVVETQYNIFTLGPYQSEQQMFYQVVDANMPLLSNSEFAIIMGAAPLNPNLAENAERVPKHLGLNSFGICLLTDSLKPGYVTWNDDSHIKYPKRFTQIAVQDSGYWLAELKNVRLGHTSIGCRDVSCGAIIDSGTSLLALPDKSYQRLQALIWKLKPDCNRMQDMPPLHFELDGQQLTLPADTYLGILEGQAISTLNTFVERPMPSHTNKTDCQQSFMHIAMESSLGETWILGMPFLRTYYTVFVQGANPKLFVARADPTCSPMNSNVERLETINQTSTARRINQTQVRMPLWAQKASYKGRLDERGRGSFKGKQAGLDGRNASGHNKSAVVQLDGSNASVHNTTGVVQ